MKKVLSLILSLSLIFQQSGFAQGLAGFLPQASASVSFDRMRPAHLRYFSYDAAGDKFDLYLDKGDVKLSQAQLSAESRKAFKYFLIGLSLPNSSFWVNLRPDSPERIVDPVIERTDIGKVLLEADVQLKKDVAMLTSPEAQQGRIYWQKLYAKADELFGSDSVEIPTFTRPWIVPGEVILRETSRGAVPAPSGTPLMASAYIYKAALEVKLEEDYIKNTFVGAGSKPALQGRAGLEPAPTDGQTDPRYKVLNEYSSQLLRELVIPQMTKAVNSASRYAALRQVYYSLILAQWFKKTLNTQGAQEHPLAGTGKSTRAQVNSYVDRIDSGNIDGLTSGQSWSKQTYFAAYQKSFKDGEYRINQTVNGTSGRKIRTYVSGGIAVMNANFGVSSAVTDTQGILSKRTNDFAGFSSSSASSSIPAISPDASGYIAHKPGSDIKVFLGGVMVDPEGKYKFNLSAIKDKWKDNIEWYIQRLTQSTAGVRGFTNVKMALDESKRRITSIEPGSLLEGQLNVAVVIICAQAYAEYIKRKSTERGITYGAFVSGDNRFFTPEITALITRIFVGNGIPVYTDIDRQSTATPAIAYMTYSFDAMLTTINITASHNGPDQNAIKSEDEKGGMDLDPKADEIAQIATDFYNKEDAQILVGNLNDPELVQEQDAKGIYFRQYVSRLFNDFPGTIKKAYKKTGIRFLFDGIGGVGGKTMAHYLTQWWGDQSWNQIVKIINDQPDPTILGIARPDPSSPGTLELTGALEALAADPSIAVGGTADMDADRTGISVIIPADQVANAKKFGLYTSEMVFDGKLVYIVRFTPQQIMALIAFDRLSQLCTQKFQEKFSRMPISTDELLQAVYGGEIDTSHMYVVTSEATSRLLEYVANLFRAQTRYRSTGFKYQGDEAEKIEKEDPLAQVIILAEESGGAIIGPFDRDERGIGITKEKDTVVLCLALYEMAANKSLEDKNILDYYIDMAQRLGVLLYYERSDDYFPNFDAANNFKNKAVMENSEAVKQEVIKKFMSLENEDPESTAILVSLFDKTSQDIERIEPLTVKTTTMFAKDEAGVWHAKSPEGRRIIFKDGSKIDIYHMVEGSGGGPMIKFYNPDGKLRFWTLIRPSGTESLARDYMEIIEPIDNPDPANLHRFFEKIMKYIGLDAYGNKAGGPSYWEEHKATVETKYNLSLAASAVINKQAARLAYAEIVDKLARGESVEEKLGELGKEIIPTLKGYEIGEVVEFNDQVKVSQGDILIYYTFTDINIFSVKPRIVKITGGDVTLIDMPTAGAVYLKGDVEGNSSIPKQVPVLIIRSEDITRTPKMSKGDVQWVVKANSGYSRLSISEMIKRFGASTTGELRGKLLQSGAIKVQPAEVKEGDIVCLILSGNHREPVVNAGEVVGIEGDRILLKYTNIRQEERGPIALLNKDIAETILLVSAGQAAMREVLNKSSSEVTQTAKGSAPKSIPPTVASASSGVGEDVGGIDLRNAMEKVYSGPGMMSLPMPPMAELEKIDLRRETQELSRMIKARMKPAEERLCKFVCACYAKGATAAASSVLMDLGRAEEEEAVPTSPQVKALLALL